MRHRQSDEQDWEMTHEYDGRHFRRSFPDTRNYTGKHERGWFARLGMVPFVGLAVGVILALGLAGCGGPTHANAPEPTASQVIDGKNNTVIREPDGFRNVSFLCFGTIGVYVTSRGDGSNSSIAVLNNDPHCVG